MSIVIEAKNLRKTYMQGKIPIRALRGVDFKVKEEELISILGPFGSGKSTLLNMIVFQYFNLIGRLSAFKNVEFPMSVAGMSKSERKNKASSLFSEIKVRLLFKLKKRKNKILGTK
ncbi:MAG: ATP-binding cassette domain-containing protein [Promethearchaeota archaeon]